MSVFQSVSSHIEDIRGTKSRTSTLQSLEAISDLLGDFKSLSSVTKKVRKLTDQIEHREIRRNRLIRTLRSQVLPKVEDMVSESSSVPDNVVAVIERTLGKASLVKNGEVDLRRDDIYWTQAEYDAARIKSDNYLHSQEDLTLYRRFMNAPVNHSHLGVNILASLANNFTQAQKEKIIGALDNKKVRPVVFCDAAVIKAYQTLAQNPELKWSGVVKSPAIQVDEYSKSFFSTKDFNVHNKAEAKYRSFAELKAAIKRLMVSFKNLNDAAKISPMVQNRYRDAYLRYNFRYRVPVYEATTAVSELLKEEEAAVNQGNIRDKYRHDYESKLPTSFSESNVFTIRHFPVEAYLRGSPSLRDPKKLESFGIKINTAQVGRLKKGASIFYEDQPLLIFDRALLKDMVLGELTEKAEAAKGNVDSKVKAARSARNLIKKQITALMSERPDAGKKRAREIDQEVTAKSADLEKAEQTLKTVNNDRAKVKKQLDDRLKYYQKNEAELLEIGLRFVIEHINSRSSTEFTLVSSIYRTNAKAKNSSMAWLMPSTLHNAMSNSFGNISVDNWNLPWGKRQKVKTEGAEA